MALSGELAKYIGNEFVGAGRKGLAKAGSKAGAKSALSSLVPSVASEVGDDIASKAGGSSLRKLLVNQAPSIAEEIPVAVGDAGKISLYRGMHADTPANLQKYIEDMKNPNIVPRTYTGNAFAGDGYHFYDNIEGAREYARDGINLGEPYGTVVKIDVPKNRFIGINGQNGNDAESFIGRALERGAKNAPEVGNKDFRNYIQQNGILGSHNTSPFGDNSQYVVMNNDATAGLEAIENYENGQLMEDIFNSGADKYLPKAPTQIKFNKDLSIRKTGGNFGYKGVKGMRGGSAHKASQSLEGLSPEQLEFFKDSAIRDKSGMLKKMYHGSPNGEIKEFNPGSYFTENKEYADGYQNPEASSLMPGARKIKNTPKTYEVYLNIKKPFTLSDAKAKDIYFNEYIKGGNSAYYDPYGTTRKMIDGLDEVDWTEGVNLMEWLQENHPEYDGMYLDEGGTGGYSPDNEYVDRGKSVVNFRGDQVKILN